MSGAANIVGFMSIIGRLKPNVEVHGIFAAAENMPDGNAYRPGDVWPSLDGKSVEIINTDAEGRLILADALAYARGLEPDILVDNATLTGACVVALGNYTAGVLSPHDKLCKPWLDAAARTGEDMWRLPLTGRLTEQLKSPIADLRNTGGRPGGAITAGLFLKEFAGSTPWVHVDIAGPASQAKEFGATAEGGVGFGVATIVEYLTS
jgi:leucyl aminopeptidase